MKLTKFEKEIQTAIRQGKVEYLPKAEAKKYQEWAKANAKKKTISLRLREWELTALKAMAAKKGKKYQTYIGEILHREAMKAA